MMICVPAKRKTAKALISAIKEAQKCAEMVEVWFDEVKDLNDKDLGKIFAMKKSRFIYKCQNTRNVEKITKFKPEYIDFDLETSTKIIEKVDFGTSKIISYHNFKETPSIKILKSIVAMALSKGADIVKLATRANNYEDSIRMLSILSECKKSGEKAICLCMGKYGKITRTAGQVLGNYLMYAPIKQADATAPGQLTIKQLKWLLK